MRESTLSPSSSYWTFAAQTARLLLSAMKVRVRFTRESRKQLSQLKDMPGSVFLRAMTIKKELALYIASHEAQNIHFNTDCQEVCYQEGIILVLHKEQGVWFITDVLGSMTPRRTPVFVWEQFKRGCNLILARLLIGWCARTGQEAAASRWAGSDRHS